jgi:hypothetical protein
VEKNAERAHPSGSFGRHAGSSAADGAGAAGSLRLVTWSIALARLAQQDPGAFLGDDLLSWLVLALGAALVVGNLAAIFRPPDRAHSDGDLARAPVARSVVMAAIGLVAAIWALASLIS